MSEAVTGNAKLFKRIAELEAEVEGLKTINAELEKASSYSLLKQNEKLKAKNERLLKALKDIASRENSGNPYDPNDHPDPYSMIEEAKEAIKKSGDTAGGGG